jgi:hypothetical protein
MSLKTYKVTRVFIVQAESREAARTVTSNDVGLERLDFESIREVVPDKAPGWRETARQVLTGKGYPEPSTNGVRHS